MGSLYACLGTQVVASRTIASIDLGTNSIHLLIIKKTADARLHVLHDRSEVVRMGQGLRQTGCIHPDAIVRTLTVLQKYQTYIQKYGCEQVYMTTTSAVREAHNQQETLDAFHKVIDFRIEVISKEEEARLSYLSIVSDLAQTQDHTHHLVADIGGGSTEIAWGMGTAFSQGQSVAIGTVKLLEGPLAGPVVSRENVKAAIEEVNTYFQAYTPPRITNCFYGTAGSFTQLAALERGLQDYDPLSIDQFALTAQATSQWIEKLFPLSIDAQKNIPGMHPDRADVALAGCIIALCLFHRLNAKTFHIRDRGIRYGKAFDVLSPFDTIVFPKTI
ncbi:MAG: hypothetical protein KDK51_03160 [Deltaproteobacteria bacterium]|nr:hypothetical protein [Deltaproteobacteria bacterium]